MKYEDFLNESAKRITYEILNEDPIFDKEEYELYKGAKNKDPNAIEKLKNKISNAAWEKRTAADNARKNKTVKKTDATIEDILDAETLDRVRNAFKRRKNIGKTRKVADGIIELLANNEKIANKAIKFFSNPGDTDFDVTYEYETGYEDEGDEYAIKAHISDSMSPIGEPFTIYFKIMQKKVFDKGWRYTEDDKYILGLNAKALLFIGGVDDNFVNKFCEKHGLETNLIPAKSIYDYYPDWEDASSSFGSSYMASATFEITRDEAEKIKDIVEYTHDTYHVNSAINHTARGRKGDIMTNPEMPTFYRRRRQR